MNGITLGGTIYILESEAVVDDTTPHNYDELINIGDEGDLDSWLGRIQAEWPDLPEEIKRKIMDSTEKYISKINTDSAEFFDDEALAGEDVVLEESFRPPHIHGLEFYGNGTWYGNEIELADGTQLQTSEPLKGRLPASVFTERGPEGSKVYRAKVILGNKLGRNIPIVDPTVQPARRTAGALTEEVEELDEAQRDTQGNEVYDFAKGKQLAASLDDDALVTVRKELIEVIKNQEAMSREGHNVPKLGYYWDEYWTVADEISRRIRKGSEFTLHSWSIDGKPVNDRLHELGE